MTSARAEATNPLLRKLSTPLPYDQLLKRLSVRPPKPGNNDRAAPAASRLEATTRLFGCYFPTADQLRFAQDFGIILRASYTQRDVAGREARIIRLKETIALGERGLIDVVSVANASSLNAALVGLPQMGKTSTVDRVLALYEQRLQHDDMSDQIVWLKFSCPSDGSLKGFCLAFFDALDRALAQSTYKEAFGQPNASAEEMPGHVIRLANIHCLGVLIIDDIQAVGPPGDDDHPILKLLLALSSSIGVPSITIGTMAAADSLQASAQLALRSVGLGSACWARLPFGSHWQAFLAQLWSYQWTRERTELTDELSSKLYECTQGIIGLAVTLYQRIQGELIRQNIEAEALGRSGESETITPEVIDAVYRHFFQFCHEHIDALASGDPRKLARFPDLQPLRSEARKAEQARKKAAAQPVVPDADVSPSEPKSENELLARHLEQSGRAMMREASVPDFLLDTWMTKIKNDLKDDLASDPREFYRQVEKLIRALVKARKKTRVIPQRQDGADLRNVLDGSQPVSIALREADLQGPRIVFGRG